MYHADQGTAFAAQALTGLHAGVGLPAVDPRASPAGEAAGGGGFVPETGDQEEAGDQETQGATQGTAPAAAQAAVQPYETGDEVGMAIHRGLGFGEGTANYSDAGRCSKKFRPPSFGNPTPVSFGKNRL